MKKKFSTRFFAFIIVIMMICGLPQFANGQKNKPCPKGYRQECYYYTCGLCARGQWICVCIDNNNGKNTAKNATNQQTIGGSFELKHPSKDSIKIYDVTGRLVRSFADSRMTDGATQIEWDAKDDNGNIVTAGTYVLQFKAVDKIESRKLSVFN